MDGGLIELEPDPSARALINDIFRTVHTIKGTSAFLAFGKVEQLAHGGESLLGSVRDGSFPFSPAIASALLELADTTRVLLRQIRLAARRGGAGRQVNRIGVLGELAVAATQ
jgi:two-component system, chemotaxis family, sensor kinase CheA